MDRRELRTTLAYGLAGLLSVGAAFMISLKFLGHSHAQAGTAPRASAAPVPAATQNPAATPADAAADPVPAGNGAAAGGIQPQTPGDEDRPTGEASELEGFLEPFIYDIVNRRDPFQPYADYVPSDQPGNTRPLTPAQRFDLDQLKLVGIMWDVKDPKALFLDPEQEVLTVGRDDGIGNHNGYIAAIREGEVVVVEAIRKRGDIIYKTRVLRLER